ncbi:MAG: hypothetical protein H7Y07_02195 [Pyrinomonadaceae bacterium]|nr:hypothetical protein [Sphingobacteriaceae bacterium]
MVVSFRKPDFYYSKTLITFLVILVWCFITQCKQESSIKSVLKDSEQTFIDKSYLDQKPLVELINPNTFEEMESYFEMPEDGDIKVYGVGELIYNLADIAPKYFFKSDDIELFFDFANYNGSSSNSTTRKYYNLSWLDGISKKESIEFIKQGVTYKGIQVVDTLNSKYLVEIKIPWDSIGIKPRTGMEMGIDIAVGDTDDEFKQKAKVALFSKADLMETSSDSYGILKLMKYKQGFDSDNKINIPYLTPVIDGQIESLWSKLKSYPLKNLLFGTVKDQYDLTARVKTCWDNASLYFMVEIQDNGRKTISIDKIRDKQTFLDYGWIEDESGVKIWQMHALYSNHAGGALKNHKTDTTLHLKKGKYTVKYTSDECHAFNNWDDDPPNTGFYGIVLYQKNVLQY